MWSWLLLWSSWQLSTGKAAFYFSLFTFATTVTVIIYHGDRYNDTSFTFTLIQVLLCDLAWKISFWSKQKTVKNSQENFHKIVVITNSQIQLGIWKMRPPDGKSCSAVNYKPSFFWASAIYSTLLLYLQHSYIYSTLLLLYLQLQLQLFLLQFLDLFVKQIQAGRRVIWELFQSFVIFFQKKGPRDQIPNLANFDIFPGVFLEAGFKIQNFAPFPWVFREAGSEPGSIFRKSSVSLSARLPVQLNYCHYGHHHGHHHCHHDHHGHHGHHHCHSIKHCSWIYGRRTAPYDEYNFSKNMK